MRGEGIKTLVEPDKIQHWIPGKITFDSCRQAWDGMSLRGYQYDDLDVVIPAMRDYMFVVYRGKRSKMSRRRDGPWENHQVEPGVVSILTRAQQSQWKWDSPIDVSHLYLSQDTLASVATEVFDRDIATIELTDCVRAEDPVLPALVSQLERELITGGIGASLYIDALKNQACVHILRRYSNIVFNDASSGGFSIHQRHLIKDFIETHLETKITIAELAELVHISSFHFSRKFSHDFGCPPHAYVMKKRVERALKLLSKTTLPIKQISCQCGFSDQSHLTRVMRRVTGKTPATFRRPKH